MVFQTKAGIRLMIYLQKIFLAWQGLPAFMDFGIYQRSIKRILNNARDRVPLCNSLQIPLNDFARSFGNEFIND